MSFLLYHKPFMRPISDCLIYVTRPAKRAPMGGDVIMQTSEKNNNFEQVRVETVVLLHFLKQIYLNLPV